MASVEFRPLGRGGRGVHPLGFGGYRIADGVAVHEAALRAYLDRGGNLIDTSANYTDGASERLIGRVLKDHARDRVVVVTKGGYIQGENLALARTRSFPEVVAYADGLWHCIHPDFLETQIQRSAERLQVETIDLYLLHNPEYFLTEIAHHRAPTADDHTEFDRRIRLAFEFLERCVRQGRIRGYGISSNHFVLPASDPTATSVARALAAARAVATDHHFIAAQLPLNLYECGGALELNNDGHSALEFCREHGLGVLANRPLNAFAHNRLVRLANFGAAGGRGPDPGALAAVLEPVRRQERQFAEHFHPKHADAGGVAALLEQIVPQLQSPAHLEQAIGPYIIEPIREWLGAAQREIGSDPHWLAWQRDFIEVINAALEAIGRYVTAKQQPESDRVRLRLLAAGYPAAAGAAETLSQMALRVLLSLPGLSSALVGMRRPEYVADTIAIAATPPLPAAEILAAFSSHQP